jgi:hypothetical protein
MITRPKMREIVLVTATALVCFGVTIPLTWASTGRSSGRQFTVWPGNAARFANMDWVCDYLTGAETTTHSAAISCHRESTLRGIRLGLTGNELRIFRCASASACRIVMAAQRTP